MHDTAGQVISVAVPDELGAAVATLGRATGRDDYDIVTSALRTYLADQGQRDTVAAHFGVTPSGYPSAYVVTTRASVTGDVVVGAAARQRAESTFGQINRYATTRLWWSSGGRSVVVDLAVSGHGPIEAGDTAAKMVRNRMVDELGLATQRDLKVEVLATHDMHCG